ncbi:MAG TPA: DUF1684 domain-containing protein [Actinomycetota bacterium]|nr:DUF1684 domain-containing protein [Actinomycetota bacterium]
MTEEGATTIEDTLTLLDYRRRIFDLYRELRTSEDLAHASARWREERDRLFAAHPQSPIPEAERGDFAGVPYYDYDPSKRVLAECLQAESRSYDIPTSGEQAMRFSRCGIATFELEGEAQELELYWLDAYGGGLFLPFRDATSGEATYGAGRYLLDTVKGADLGTTGDRLILDFNFAYNPSCAYDPRWVCPLAPPSNRLSVGVTAGERT